MATIGATNPTLADWAKLQEPTGGITTDLVEMLTQQNEILEDMTFMEANGTTYHRSSIRTGLPTPTWRQFYQGVQPTKSSYTQISDTLGMLEARTQVDQKLADLESDREQFRLIEAYGQIEGISQELAATIIYGNVNTSPTKFNGLAPRFNDNTTALSKENVIDAGGTGTDNTSIWVIAWSPRTVFGIFPKGSQSGLQRTDLGLNHHARPPDGTAGEFSAYEEKFTFDAGLVVRDWRAVVRVANIDVSNLVGESSAADILKNLTKATTKLRRYGTGTRMAIYMNSTVLTMLDIQAQAKSNLHLTYADLEGKPLLTYRGTPIRMVDQILLTEAQVT